MIIPTRFSGLKNLPFNFKVHTPDEFFNYFICACFRCQSLFCFLGAIFWRNFQRKGVFIWKVKSKYWNDFFVIDTNALIAKLVSCHKWKWLQYQLLSLPRYLGWFCVWYVFTSVLYWKRIFVYLQNFLSMFHMKTRSFLTFFLILYSKH